MKIFILDQKIEDINKLKEIINNRNLDKIIGYSQDVEEGIEDILLLNPDLIILDMLDKDNNSFYIINKVKKQNINTRFILISNNTNKENVEKAYKEGIEYFIYKPINTIEIENMLNKMSYILDLEKKLYKIKQIFNEIEPAQSNKNDEKQCEDSINSMLMKLGILGEVGSADISKVVEYLVRNNINLNSVTMKEICAKFTANPKVMEQRMRRTIALAMSNIASIGIEDYMNETFTEYSNTLFNFEQIRLEMDKIRGKSKYGGSINMKKFLSTMSIICQIHNN